MKFATEANTKKRRESGGKAHLISNLRQYMIIHYVPACVYLMLANANIKAYIEYSLCACVCVPDNRSETGRMRRFRRLSCTRA